MLIISISNCSFSLEYNICETLQVFKANAVEKKKEDVYFESIENHIYISTGFSYKKYNGIR